MHNPGNFVLSQKNGSCGSTDHVLIDVEEKEFPELFRNFPVKVSIDSSSCELYACGSATCDPVEFLQWVTVVRPVKVDDAERSVFIQDHIADMIVAVLKTLLEVVDQMAVCGNGNVCENFFVVRELDAVYAFVRRSIFCENHSSQRGIPSDAGIV